VRGAMLGTKLRLTAACGRLEAAEVGGDFCRPSRAAAKRGAQCQPWTTARLRRSGPIGGWIRRRWNLLSTSVVASTGLARDSTLVAEGLIKAA